MVLKEISLDSIEQVDAEMVFARFALYIAHFIACAPPRSAHPLFPFFLFLLTNAPKALSGLTMSLLIYCIFFFHIVRSFSPLKAIAGQEKRPVKHERLRLQNGVPPIVAFNLTLCSI